jgi:hypothetical protein
VGRLSLRPGQSSLTPSAHPLSPSSPQGPVGPAGGPGFPGAPGAKVSDLLVKLRISEGQDTQSSCGPC